MPRDNKGRFVKTCEDSIKINFRLLIIMPWVSIITRFNFLKKILELFDELINTQIEDPIKAEKMENFKKKKLFY